MLKKYKPFIRASAMDMMTWRFNILVWVIVTVFEVACLIFLWLAVYSSSEGGIDASINGFTYKEMISYVVLTCRSAHSRRLPRRLTGMARTRTR